MELLSTGGGVNNCLAFALLKSRAENSRKFHIPGEGKVGGRERRGNLMERTEFFFLRDFKVISLLPIKINGKIKNKENK